MKFVWKYLGLITALLFIVAAFTGLINIPLYAVLNRAIPPENWNWAARFAPIVGMWIGTSCCYSLATYLCSAFTPDAEMQEFERRYKAHLDQAYGDPIMEAGVNDIWRTFASNAEKWLMGTWWASQLKVDWGRAVHIAYNQAIIIIWVCIFVIAVPYAVQTAAPVRDVLSLALAIAILVGVQKALALAILGSVSTVPPRPPFTIPTMLLEDIPRAPLDVRLKRVWSKLRAKKSRRGLEIVGAQENH